VNNLTVSARPSRKDVKIFCDVLFTIKDVNNLTASARPSRKDVKIFCDILFKIKDVNNLTASERPVSIIKEKTNN